MSVKELYTFKVYTYSFLLFFFCRLSRGIPIFSWDFQYSFFLFISSTLNSRTRELFARRARQHTSFSISRGANYRVRIAKRCVYVHATLTSRGSIGQLHSRTTCGCADAIISLLNLVACDSTITVQRIE